MRLEPGERVVVEPGRPDALRVFLPRRCSWILVDGDQPVRARVDGALVGALQQAHTLLAASETAAPVNHYTRRLVNLALLALDIQCDILQGRQPRGLALAELLRREPPSAGRSSSGGCGSSGRAQSDHCHEWLGSP